MKLRLGVRPSGQVYIQFADSSMPSGRGTLAWRTQLDEHDALKWDDLQAEARKRMNDVGLARATASEQGVV